MKNYKVGPLQIAAEWMPGSYKPFEVITAAQPHYIVHWISEEPILPKESSIDAGDFCAVQVPGGWAYCTRQNTVKVLVGQKKIRIWQNGKDKDCSDWAEHLLRIALECKLIEEGYISLHAACVVKDGQAFCFSGASGVGKSTRAKLWVDTLDAQWLSGDRPAVDCQNGIAYGVPWDGKEQLFHSSCSPIRAILMVYRASYTELRILSAKETIQMLAAQCFIPMWDADLSARVFENLTQLVQTVCCYQWFGGIGAQDAAETSELLAAPDKDIKGVDTMIRLKDGFTVRNIAGEYMALPVGENIATFNGTVVLNEVSAFIIEKLKQPLSEDELIKMLLSEYDVDEQTAQKDVKELLKKLDGYGMLEKIV